MGNWKVWSSASAAALAMVVAGALAAAEAGQPAVTIRKAPEQVVLYTLYRGPYDGVGPVIGKLMMQAGQKGIAPQGNISFAYLNNPGLTTKEHNLVEIRVPVGQAALKLAGTLGEFTDVKALPAMDLAVIVKPKGVSDPTQLRAQLAAWIHDNGYEAVDACSETFLGMGGGYADMESEIAYPVRKLAAAGGK